MFSLEYIRQINALQSDDPSDRSDLFDSDIKADLLSYTIDPECNNEQWIYPDPFGFDGRIVITGVLGSNYFDLIWNINEAEAVRTCGTYENVIEGVLYAIDALFDLMASAIDQFWQELQPFDPEERPSLYPWIATDPPAQWTKDRSTAEAGSASLLSDAHHETNGITMGEYKALLERQAEAGTLERIPDWLYDQREAEAEANERSTAEANQRSTMINGWIDTLERKKNDLSDNEANEDLRLRISSFVLWLDRGWNSEAEWNEAEAGSTYTDLLFAYAEAFEADKARTAEAEAVLDRWYDQREAEAVINASAEAEALPIKRIDILRTINDLLITLQNEAEARSTAEAVDQCSICCDSPTYNHDLYMRTIHPDQAGSSGR